MPATPVNTKEIIIVVWPGNAISCEDYALSIRRELQEIACLLRDEVQIRFAAVLMIVERFKSLGVCNSVLRILWPYIKASSTSSPSALDFSSHIS